MFPRRWSSFDSGWIWLICQPIHDYWTVSYIHFNCMCPWFTSYFVSAITAASAALLYLPVLHLYGLFYLLMAKMNEWMNEWMSEWVSEWVNECVGSNDDVRLYTLVCRGSRVRELRCHVHSTVASRRHRTLPVQRMRTLPQDERPESTSHQAETTTGQWIHTRLTTSL